jgi:hypothetical protein
MSNDGAIDHLINLGYKQIFKKKGGVTNGKHKNKRQR